MCPTVLSVLWLCGAGTATDPAPSKKDLTFAEKAMRDNVTEVEIGKIAVRRGRSQEAKDFGQHLIDDHTAAGDDLKGWAAGKGVDLPGQPNADQQKVIDKLKACSDGGFDREFAKVMVDDHKKAIGAFERAAKDSTDPDLRAYASRTVPKLQMHLDMAKKLDKPSKAS